MLKGIDKGYTRHYNGRVNPEKEIDMPTKGTSIISTRVKDEIVLEIKRKADRRGMSLNSWVNWAIVNGLRKHSKKGNGNGLQNS